MNRSAGAPRGRGRRGKPEAPPKGPRRARVAGADRGSRSPRSRRGARFAAKGSTFSTRGGTPSAPVIGKLISRQPWGSLVRHLLEPGVDADVTIQRLKIYARLLIEWNRGVSNLISRNDEPRIVERHIAESIEPAAWLKTRPAGRWLDFGSGAGLPALPLAIAGVGTSWTLVESRRMKTLFIRKATEALELKHIEIVVARLENMVSETQRLGAYDAFTSRATLALVPTLALAAQFVAPGGTAYLWKGSQREAEMSDDPSWQRLWEHDGLLGIGNGQTVVVRFTRKS